MNDEGFFVLPLSPEQPALLAVVGGLAFCTGILLVGLPAPRRGWVHGEAAYLSRLIATLVGVYLPLTVALALNAVHEVSSFVSMLGGIAGFHLAGWMGRHKQSLR